MSGNGDIAALSQLYGAKPVSARICHFRTDKIIDNISSVLVQFTPISLSQTQISRKIIGARLLSAEFWANADGYFGDMGITCSELAHVGLGPGQFSSTAVDAFPILGWYPPERTATGAAGNVDNGAQTGLVFHPTNLCSALMIYDTPRELDSLTFGFIPGANFSFTLGFSLTARFVVILYTI